MRFSSAAVVGLAALMAVGLTVTACGGHSSATSTSSSSSGAAATTVTAPTPVTTATTNSSAGSDFSASPTASAADPAPCSSTHLTVSLGGGPGAGASHLGIGVRFTNRSAEPCTLFGFPGVSYVAGADGHQVGAAATRVTGSPTTTIVLAPGGLASALLDEISDPPAVLTPSACGPPVEARGLRVYPPGQTVALFVPAPQQVCSAAGAHELTISAVQNGPQPS